MKKLVVLSVVAVLGLILAIMAAQRGQQAPPVVAPVVAPGVSNFAATVAGAGLVEPAGDVVRIGAPLSDVVAEVLVEAGQAVAAGAPLVTLDARATRAQELVQVAQLMSASAALDVARSARDEAADNAQRAKEGLVSVEERARRLFAHSAAQARVVQAEAAIAQAQAALSAVRIELDRRIVRAPRAGTVLRVDVRPGEFASAGRMDPPLVTMGDLERLQIRVDIDENDAWRVRASASAEGVVRGNPTQRMPLHFLRIEPYVVPKKSLTGASSERVDTRVLQIIYRLPRGTPQLYAGQQLDVFIATDPVAAGRP